MRHLVKGKKLGRTASHRKATLQALAVALILDRRITTTITKAKELRRYVEPLITRAKVDTTHNRRQVFSKLQDKYAVTELFEEVGPLAKDRPGGYTRVLRIGYRQGDGAEMAVIELVDYNDVKPETARGRRKRTRRAGRSKKTTPAQPAEAKDTVEDQQTEEPKTETAAAEPDQEVETAEEQEPKTAETADEAKAEAEAAETKTEAEADQGHEAEAEKDIEEKKQATAEEESAETVQTSSDLLVDEVKEKLESMSLEEARKFAGDDERVTVQRALQKMIDDADAEEENGDRK